MVIYNNDTTIKSNLNELGNKKLLDKCIVVFQRLHREVQQITFGHVTEDPFGQWAEEAATARYEYGRRFDWRTPSTYDRGSLPSINCFFSGGFDGHLLSLKKEQNQGDRGRSYLCID